ncbi:pentatricopeptide repeat-containing protein At1g66345, mitochondrial [Amborella trichopoda]|nr:pentatricopeptide repeat-containing protein At1g66345, mitochondrial [Amborella trichopoda]|eukprot:XP_006828175.2 pentatricopeptide repeat-containing protein At1g66345, mitochondrial [Amborella trichopoda]
MCDMLRTSGNWNDLSLRFGVINLNEAIIEQVLLNLKEPNEAKLALSFFHWSSLCKKIDHGLSTYCIIVDILVQFELFTHAQALLESTMKKHCIGDSGFPKLSESLLGTYDITGSSFRVFDFLVQTYARLRMFDEAISSYSLLQKYGFSPSIVTWNILLNFVQKSNQSTLVWRIYEDMLMRRTYPNVITKVDKAIGLLTDLLDMGFSPDEITYGLLIDGYNREGHNIQDTPKLYYKMKFNGPSIGHMAYSLMIGDLCRRGKVKEAEKILKVCRDKLLSPTKSIYNILIIGHCESGNIEKALYYYDEMIRDGLTPPSRTLRALAELANKDNTLLIVNEVFDSLANI